MLLTHTGTQAHKHTDIYT